MLADEVTPVRRNRIHNLLIVLIAGFLCLPCLVHGLPLVGTAMQHTNYQHEFSHQFWNGEFYPRWMATGNRGYGSPIFLIQYPLPYYIATLIQPLTAFPATPDRESRELGVLYFLILMAAGLNTRLWLKKNCRPAAATLGAIAYMCLPSILPFAMYNEVALGQLTAVVCMPLALAACDSLRLKVTAVTALGVVWALLTVSNFLTAVLFLPLMVGYVIAGRYLKKMPLSECSLALLLSLTIGTCLAAVYLLPFFVYSKLFDISAVNNLPGYSLSSNFAYVRSANLGSRSLVVPFFVAAFVAIISARSIWRECKSGSLLRFYMLLVFGLGALIATPGLGSKLVNLSGLRPPSFRTMNYYPEKLLATALLTVAFAGFCYSQIAKSRPASRDSRHALLIVTACTGFLMMTPWSSFFWRAVPVLAKAIQYPHRVGLVVTIATAGLFAAALDGLFREESLRGVHAGLVAFMTGAVILGGILTWRADVTWRRTLQNFPEVFPDEQSLNVDRMYHTYVSPSDWTAFEKLPAAEAGDVQPVPAEGTTEYMLAGQGMVQVTRQSPRKLLVSYTALTEGHAPIGVVYSRLWKMEASNSSEALPLKSSQEGLIDLPLVAGVHTLELVFDGGWPEHFGFLITCWAAVLISAAMLFQVATQFGRRRKYRNLLSQKPEHLLEFR